MRSSGFRLASRAAALVATLLAAACATPPTPRPEVGIEAASQRPAAEDRTAPPGRLKPMPVRPLTVKANCHFKDEVGYSASAMLDINYSDVRAFSATVEVPKRGNCRFDLADFQQVHKEAHVELLARDGCTVRMWEQGDQVTVAFTECANRCTRGTFDYVWPILLDRPSGQCN